jgi:colanic acid/amylovoran biosynthesis glycosyltransferase
VVYVTARLPYGDGEPFVATEARALERHGWEVTLVPVRTGGAIVHPDAARLRTEAVPLMSAAIARDALAEAVRRPAAALGALAGLARSRGPRLLAKNLAVFPKGLWLARRARRMEVDHLHAHWASTSSTMAMVAGRVSGISWSVTAHRWDIAENNLLRTKARDACFFRVISEHGAEELRALIGESRREPWVLRMGVDLPEAVGHDVEAGGPLRVLTAARLVQKKGHMHLIDAVRVLSGRGIRLRVELAGDGPRGSALRQRVADFAVEEDVVFLGTVPHHELLARMAAGDWDVAVLPSVVTDSGELEGIPVSLIEAMASGLPAVGTESGGVSELLGDGAGILVPPADVGALARALEALATDPALRARLGAAGRRRVEERFDVERVAAELAARFRECAEDQASKSA